MIEFRAGRLILIAVAVYVVWRIVCWRRRGGDPMREAVAALVFGWSLVVASLTFFPMIIIFYDWYGSSNLIPLKSIVDLVRNAPSQFALRNVAGNLLLLAPFGLLLPLLFEKLRRPWPLAWRMAVVAVAIEIGQLFTRVRATDVDDVILNALGALLGLGLYWAAWAVARRSRRAATAAARIASPSRRDPLLIAAVPVGIATVLLVASLIPPLMDATMSERDAFADATSGLQGGVVAATADVGDYLFLLVRGGRDDAERVRFAEYKRVLPGRYTWTARGDLPRRGASRYAWGMTTYNVTRDEKPLVVVYGRNEARATSLIVHSGDGATERAFPIDTYFVVALPYDFAADVAGDGIINDLRYSFLDASGRDVTDEFATD